MARDKTRQDKRRPQKMRDNHNRQWFATIEKESGFPTGYIKPLFQVPHPSLVPPQKYLDIPADNPGALVINYDRWVGDLRQSHQEWEERRLREGRTLHGTSFNPKAPPTRELLETMGPKPMAVEPVLAMKQGNKWALGLSDVRPPEADRYFPVTEVVEDARVFSGEAWTEPQPEIPAGTLIEQLERECPAELKGAARNGWIVKELKARTVGV